MLLILGVQILCCPVIRNKTASNIFFVHIISDKFVNNHTSFIRRTLFEPYHCYDCGTENLSVIVNFFRQFIVELLWLGKRRSHWQLRLLRWLHLKLVKWELRWFENSLYVYHLSLSLQDVLCIFVFLWFFLSNWMMYHVAHNNVQWINWWLFKVKPWSKYKL